MRWKISHHDHDPRQIDLLAVIVLVILIVGAYGYLAEHTSSPPAPRPSSSRARACAGSPSSWSV